MGTELELELELDLVYRDWEIVEIKPQLDMIYIWMCYQMYCICVINQLLIHIFPSFYFISHLITV